MKNQATILIADDEPFIRRSLSFILKKEGYDVEQAEDGQQAWEKLLHGFKPDVVFLDIMMPRLNGFEVCKMIKSSVQFKDFYVILLTARWRNSDREYAETIGVDEYITKPFSPSYIARRLRTILERRQGVVHE